MVALVSPRHLGSGLLVLLQLSACSARAPEFAPLPDEAVASGAGFVLTLSPDGNRILQASAALDFQSSMSSPLTLEVEDESRVVLVALDEEKLTALGIEPNWALVGSISMDVSTESCERGRLSAQRDGLRLRVAIPAGMKAFELASSGARFESIEFASVPAMAMTSFEIPIERSVCSGARDIMAEAFDPDAPAFLTAGATVRQSPAFVGGRLSLDFTIRGLEPVSDELLVAVSPAELFHVRRGRPYQDEAAQHLSTGEVLGLPPSNYPAPLGWRWSGVHSTAAWLGGTGRLVALTFEAAPNDVPVARSALVMIDFDDDGFLHAETATVTSGTLREVRVDERGRLLALGTPFEERLGSSGQSLIVHAASASAPLQRRVFSTAQGGTSLLVTGIEGRPHLAGFAGSEVLVGDLTGPLEDVRELQLEGDAGLRARIESLAVPNPNNASGFWAGDSHGQLYRASLLGETAERLSIKLPVEAVRCGSAFDACGYRRPNDIIHALEPIEAGDRMLVSILDCDMLFAIRASDLCTSRVLVPPAPHFDATSIQRTLVRRGDRVFVADLGSEIYVFDAH